MDDGMAASFRQGLELVSAGTLIAVRRPPIKLCMPSLCSSCALQRVQALSLSTLTQVNVWREVRTTGEDHEHDDYKARKHRFPYLQQSNMI